MCFQGQIDLELETAISYKRYHYEKAINIINITIHILGLNVPLEQSVFPNRIYTYEKKLPCCGMAF